MIIIETNISYDNLGRFSDHQNRIIECDSWEEYVESFKINKPIYYKGNIDGYNFIEKYEMSDLKYDDFHLSCHFSNGIKHLAYVIENFNY